MQTKFAKEKAPFRIATRGRAVSAVAFLLIREKVGGGLAESSTHKQYIILFFNVNESKRVL